MDGQSPVGRLWRIAALAGVIAGMSDGAMGATPSGAAFLQVTPSARSYALGQANGITALGAEAIGANPANLGLMPRRFDAYTSYERLLDGEQFEHLAAAFSPRGSLGSLDGLGISVTRLENSGFNAVDASGNRTGSSFGSSDMALSLSGSALLSSSLRAGLSAKFIQSSLAGYSANTQAADLGLTYTMTAWRRPLSIGTSVTNVGPGVRFISQSDPLPTTLNLGAAVPLGAATAVLEINRLIYQQQTQASLGVEVGLGPVSFRAGYLAKNQAGNLALADQKNGSLLGGLSGGVGIKLGIMRIDYAMSEQAADYGTTQRVALSFAWGGGQAQAASTSSTDWKPNRDRSDWLLRSMGTY